MIEIINDPHTLFLLHGESLTDSSGYHRAIEASGVTISAAQSKFGGNSLYFNGSSRLSIENLLNGSMPFTIEAWVYPTKTANNTFWSHGGSNVPTGTGGVVEYYSGNIFMYYCNAFLIQTSATYSINQWYHVALAGDGSSIKLYIDGTLIGTHSGVYNFSNVTETFGDNDSAPGQEGFQGYIDELRVSDVVRWSGSFTPPAAPYTASAINITPGGVIIKKYALRRRILVDAPFTFEYTGSFTDNRDANGIGTVRLNTSGTLTVTGSPVTVVVTIVGAGGGGAYSTKYLRAASGGGGGNQTVEVTLEPGTYDIVVGTGGTAHNAASSGTAGTGGNTIAFGTTSTGGTGGTAGTFSTNTVAGVGGSPNGVAGATNYNATAAGGSPNGGASGQAGGNGYVDLMFS